MFLLVVLFHDMWLVMSHHGIHHAVFFVQQMAIIQAYQTVDTLSFAFSYNQSSLGTCRFVTLKTVVATSTLYSKNRTSVSTGDSPTCTYTHCLHSYYSCRPHVTTFITISFTVTDSRFALNLSLCIRFSCHIYFMSAHSNVSSVVLMLSVSFSIVVCS